MSTRSPSTGILAILIACAGCSEKFNGPVPKVWTVFDVQALYASGKTPDDAIATDAGLAGGVPLGRILRKDTGSLAVADTLNFYVGAYVTTEVWQHFDRVWVQPMYIPITGWRAHPDTTNLVPTTLLDDGGFFHPVFPVGPESGFYSPFWQIVYFQVPEGTAADAVKSLREITEAGYPLTQSIGRTVSLVPPGTVVDVNGSRVSGSGDMAVATPVSSYGWVDGRQVTYLDFGKSLFSWDAERVVDEVPIYHFVFRGHDGVARPLDVPTVVAPGPPHTTATEPPTIAGELRYSAYWRLYQVVVPPSARVFAPMEVTEQIRPGLYTALTMSGFAVAPETAYGGTVTAQPPEVLSEYIGRIAMNPGACFQSYDRLIGEDPMDVTANCIWLDSQLQIEKFVDPTAVTPTDISVTCPLLSVQSQPVTPMP